MSKVVLAITSAFLISIAIAFQRATEGRVADIFILTLHNFGFVLGTGAATIINIFNALAEKNEALGQSKMPAFLTSRDRINNSRTCPRSCRCSQILREE
jgi:hypothetical protein